MSAHWRESKETRDDEGRFAVVFTVTFDRGASPAKLKLTCRISETFSDEIENGVEDPQQSKFAL